MSESPGWGAEAPRRRFLGQLWAAVKDLANTVFHEPNQLTILDLGELETRTHPLLLTGSRRHPGGPRRR